MMKKSLYSILFFFLMFVSVPGYSTPALSTSEANAVLKQAMSLHKEAVANEGGWRITEKFIKKAKKLLDKGDRRKALEVASMAREYAELSGKLAESEKKNWAEPPYLK